MVTHPLQMTNAE